MAIIIVLSLFIKCFEANTIFEWFDLEFSHARAMSNFFGFWLVRGRGEIVLRKRALDSTFCPFVFFRFFFYFSSVLFEKNFISYFSFRYCRISIVYWMVKNKSGTNHHGIAKFAIYRVFDTVKEIRRREGKSEWG